MESNKQKGSFSSSSSCSELFGSKESHHSSSNGIFSSIFSTPSPKVLGRESLRTELNNGKIVNESLRYNKIGTQDGKSKNIDGETQNTQKKDLSFLYQDQRVQQPCHLSSSIYYGGQDIYSHPQNTQNSGLNSLYKNEAVEDDAGTASRGNWWQGSLYY